MIDTFHVSENGFILISPNVDEITYHNIDLNFNHTNSTFNLAYNILLLNDDGHILTLTLNRDIYSYVYSESLVYEYHTKDNHATLEEYTYFTDK